MLMPSGPLRRALRAAGHHLAPVVQVGKEGVTPAVARQAAQALADHELVKVKVGTESPEDRFEAADRLREATGAAVAQILGRTLLLYLRHPEKSRHEPDLAPRPPAPPPPASRLVPRRTRASRRGGARPAPGRRARRP
jgi:RNA-binding protein